MFEKNLTNSFFNEPYSSDHIAIRINEVLKGKVGFYSVGLYPASLAYNCAMQNNDLNILLAPRNGRELFGAFSERDLSDMDNDIKNKIESMAISFDNKSRRYNTLKDLLIKCELVVLSSNSKNIINDINFAFKLRKELDRENVLIACLVGSFCHDNDLNESFVLCEKLNNLAFFSGFHRHGALRNPLDSFTANFCHPDAMNAILGAKLLNKISPNIQVSAGVHNVEGQYIKAAKNISSILAGFGHTYHKKNPGLLPTLLTLLLDQCLDQAAYVSMSREDRENLYKKQPFPITELGYGVQLIEASLYKDGNFVQVRDHTFSQLKAMVADVRGSMMLPVSGSPTRNFQAGEVLAEKMIEHKRCPYGVEEFLVWCENSGLKRGALEGINSLNYWPDIIKKYLIPLNDSSMINLLYMCIMGPIDIKDDIYNVMTNSRELTNYCQESVKSFHSKKISDSLNNFHLKIAMDFIAGSLTDQDSLFFESNDINFTDPVELENKPIYNKVIDYIENYFIEVNP
ncbi:hypothetical protein [Prochlorococcus marinus]|uniref:Uncharacterized protein n=1 Tax=Prochlorococcus marinus XMU1408 TaxID=2213228 RepID=A0A318R5C4_PROMR|nr:hypothetical protein [Prochlorococcus marinus]MBW3041669.1 hypothetical protein [Prochlorococcus marinus str. XMU1408]PYE02822.1 hypothetical protein DNJ73_03460 [Prochlorococcus marinus XMU1408]